MISNFNFKSVVYLESLDTRAALYVEYAKLQLQNNLCIHTPMTASLFYSYEIIYGLLTKYAV